jgi:DNA-binding response OmpR family regulator
LHQAEPDLHRDVICLGLDAASFLQTWKEVDPTLLLVTTDPTLVELVQEALAQPWKLIHHGEHSNPWLYFAHPNIRMVILDDQDVAEPDRGWLSDIRRRAMGAQLIYVTSNHSEAVEKLARRNGAQYYISKPLSPELFGRVLHHMQQDFIGRVQVE